MNSRLPIALLTAFALAAPGATSYGKDKDKQKDKDKKEHKSDHRDDRSDDRHGEDENDRDRDDRNRGGKITICHIPSGNNSARHTISVSQSAWSAHRGHGDRRGACARPGTGGGRFDELDVNNDGVISLSEWRTGDRATFDRLDRNNNGVITRDEFARY